MLKYDVIVIGAGPAGGQCARDLSQNGYSVLLIDKAKSFLDNNYSSGGAPLEILSDFNLPERIAHQKWRKLQIHSTYESSSWHSPIPLGPVLHFDQLRQFLSDEVTKHNGRVSLGHCYQSHSVERGTVKVQIKDLHLGSVYEISSSVVVDATGSERKVLNRSPQKKMKTCSVTGIEYHIKVDPAIYTKYSESLNFYLGHRWMPQGYAWIFPHSSNQLKIGVIRYFQNQFRLPYNPSYQYYVNQLIEMLGGMGSIQVLDKHGKTIHYTMGQKDKLHEAPLLAIGDAVSAINPLGSEGIRHGMMSGRFAANAIDDYLKGRSSSFKSYSSSLNKYFGWKWFWSEMLIKGLYLSTSDQWIDRSVKSFGSLSLPEIYDVIFNYKFAHAIKPYLSTTLSHLKSKFKK